MRSVDGFLLPAVEHELAEVFRPPVEIELAPLRAEVIRGGLVPDHPERRVGVHRLLADGIDRQGPEPSEPPKPRDDMKASHGTVRAARLYSDVSFAAS